MNYLYQAYQEVLQAILSAGKVALISAAGLVLIAATVAWLIWSNCRQETLLDVLEDRLFGKKKG